MRRFFYGVLVLLGRIKSLLGIWPAPSNHANGVSLVGRGLGENPEIGLAALLRSFAWAGDPSRPIPFPVLSPAKNPPDPKGGF